MEQKYVIIDYIPNKKELRDLPVDVTFSYSLEEMIIDIITIADKKGLNVLYDEDIEQLDDELAVYPIENRFDIESEKELIRDAVIKANE